MPLALSPQAVPFQRLLVIAFYAQCIIDWCSRSRSPCQTALGAANIRNTFALPVVIMVAGIQIGAPIRLSRCFYLAVHSGPVWFILLSHCRQAEHNITHKMWHSILRPSFNLVTQTTSLSVSQSILNNTFLTVGEKPSQRILVWRDSLYGDWPCDRSRARRGRLGPRDKSSRRLSSVRRCCRPPSPSCLYSVWRRDVTIHV